MVITATVPIYCNILTLPVFAGRSNYLSHLVAHHRRKLRADAKHDVMKVGGTKLLQLCLLLRLAVLVNHSRSDEMLPAIELKVKNAQQWQLSISGDAKQWPL